MDVGKMCVSIEFHRNTATRVCLYVVRDFRAPQWQSQLLQETQLPMAGTYRSTCLAACLPVALPVHTSCKDPCSLGNS